MKKQAILMLILASIITLTGCKKDKFADKTTQEKILGKWKFVSVTTETTRPSTPVETITEQADEGDYFDFRNDGELYLRIGANSQEEQTPYSVESENTLKIEGDTYTITELTAQKLVFEFVKVSSTRTRKQIYTLSR